MKSKAKTKKIPTIRRSRWLHVFFILSFAGIASALIVSSKAAESFKNSPVGTADYCRLEGSATVIYGWAHDSQAGATDNPRVNVTVGAKSVRTATSIDGYRNSEINTYLSNNNYKTASKYGFKVSFAGMYKGTAPVISGTVENVQEGSDQALRINQSSAIQSGPPDKYYFTNGKVPDACLPSRPVVTPPTTPTTPPSTPTPTPSTPPPSGSTGSGTRSPTKPPATSSTSNTPAPAATDNSTIPNASVIYTLNLKLVNSTTPASNIVVSLRDAEAETTTNDEGVASFSGLKKTKYTAQFSYQNNYYEHEISFSESQLAAATVDQTVDITTLTPTTESPDETSETADDAPVKKSNPFLIVFLVLLGLAALGGGIFYYLRKRRSTTDYDTLPLPTYDAPTPPLPQAPPLPTKPTVSPSEQQPGENHIGVSLKDLVVQSMREEAARRRDNDKQQ